MIFQTKLKTAPTTSPVSVADVKAYLKIDDTTENLILQSLIDAATARVENYLDKKLINQTWLLYADSFPRGSKAMPWQDGVIDASIAHVLGFAPSIINLPFGPLSSVTSVKYFDDADASTLFAASNYSLDTVGPFGRISLKSGSSWPSQTLRTVNGVEIEAVFGYGATVDDVPIAIRNAIKLIVGKLFEDRGDDVDGEMGSNGPIPIPKTAMFLLEPHRSIKVGNC